MKNRLRSIIGPSPLFMILDKAVCSSYQIGEGDFDSDASSSASRIYNSGIYEALETEIQKPRRLSNKEISDLMKIKEYSKWKDTDICELINHAAEVSGDTFEISDTLEDVLDYVSTRTVHKFPLRLKGGIVYTMFTYLTQAEMRKIALANILEMSHLPFTLDSYLGLALPSFFFCYGWQKYVPDSLKQPLNVGMWTLGAPIIISSFVVDKIGAPFERKKYGIAVPLDITMTGGSIPKEISSISEIKALISEKVSRDLKGTTFPK